MDHEIPLELFRNRPELAPEVLRTVFGLPIPDCVDVFLGSENFNAVKVTEYICDVSVIVGKPAEPELAIVLEMQRRFDKDKQFTWPVYLSTLRARHRCPVTLLVLCPDAKTAAACAEPIDTGHPDWILKPLAMSPEDLPVVTDIKEAESHPELTVLSTLGHAEGPQSREVLEAFCAAVEAAERDPGTQYYDYVRTRLSNAARGILEEIMSVGAYEFTSDFALKHKAEGKAEGKVEGKAEGERRAVLLVLGARGLAVSGQARDRIVACSDLEVLEIWVQRAATVAATEEIFD